MGFGNKIRIYRYGQSIVSRKISTTVSNQFPRWKKAKIGDSIKKKTSPLLFFLSCIIQDIIQRERLSLDCTLPSQYPSLKKGPSFHMTSIKIYASENPYVCGPSSPHLMLIVNHMLWTCPKHFQCT